MPQTSQRILAHDTDIAKSKPLEVSDMQRVILDSINAAIFLHTPEGTIFDVNERMLQLYGVDRAEALTLSIAGDYSAPGPQVAQLPALWARVLAGESLLLDWQARRPKDGSVFDAEIFLRRITLPGQEAILVTVQDISARKQGERKLAAQQAQLAADYAKLQGLFRQIEGIKREWEVALDATSGLVLVVDPADRIKRCNKAVRQLAGKPYSEILGADWRTLLDAIGLHIPSTVASGTEICLTATNCWYVLRTYALPGDNPELAGTVITLHDTTEMKRVSQELDRAYRELQASQSQMLQREKMAGLGQLAAGVAHEINNPLSFIQSNLGTLGTYVERLCRYADAQAEVVDALATTEQTAALAALRKQLKLDVLLSDLPELIAESQEGTSRVKTIVQNLKSFARIDNTGWQESDINACLENTLSIVWNELKYKAEVQRDYGDLPLVLCHSGELNQVFMNLLINAAQALVDRGTIGVRTRALDGKVRVEISDTGCGIPPETQSRIFEPFFTTKEVGKGTGLGLSISYDIVKRHGGELDVVSAPEKGTTFTVSLPISREDGST